MAAKGDQARPARGRKRSLPWRLLRGLLLTIFWVSLVLILLVLAVLSVARLPAAQERLVGIVVNQVKSQLPGLSLGAIRGDYTSNLSVYGVKLRDRFGGEAVSLGALHLAYAPGSLLSGKAVVERIELVKPTIVVRTAKSGKLNLAELLAPSRAKKEEPPKEDEPGDPLSGEARLDALRIIDGSITLALDPEAAPIEIRGLNLELSAAAGPKRQRLKLNKLAFVAKLPERPPIKVALDVAASLEGERPITEVGALTARRADAKVGLQVEGALPGSPLKLLLKAAGPLSASKLELAVSLPGSASLALAGEAGVDGKLRPRFDLRATLRKLDPKRLLASLLPGDLNLELKLKGQGVPLEKGSKLDASLNVGPSRVGPVKVQGLALRSFLEGKRWRLAKLSLRAGKTRINAAGAGNLSRLERLRLRVHAPDLSRLPIPVKVPGLAGSLRVAVGAKGPFAGPLQASLNVRARGVTVAKASVGSLDVKARFRGLPKRPRGSLELRASSVSPGDPNLALSRVALDVSGHQGKLAIELDAEGKKLSAHLAAQLALLTKAKAAGDVALRRIRAVLSALRFRGFGQRVALKGETRIDVLPGRKVAVSGLRLATYGGEVGVDATLKQRGEPRLAAVLSLAGIVPPLGKGRKGRRAARRLRVGGKLTAEVRSRRAVAKSRLTIGRRGRLSLDAALPLRRRRGQLLPTELVWTSPARLKLALQGVELSRLRAMLGEAFPARSGAVGVELNVQGPLRDPRVLAAVKVSDVVAMGLRGLGLRVAADVAPGRSKVEVDATMGRGKLLALRAETALGAGAFIARRPPRALAAAPMNITLRVPELDLARLAPLGKTLGVGPLEQLEGKLSADVTASGEAREPRLAASVRLLGGKLDEQTLGALAVTLKAALGQTKSTLEVEARAGAAKLPSRPLLRLVAQTKGLDPLLLARRGVGVLPLQGRLHLLGFDLATLRGYLPRFPKLAGKLAGQVHIEGDSKQPRVDADLTLGGLRFAAVPVGDLRLGGGYDAKRHRAQGKVVLQQGGAKGRGSGRLEVGADVDLRRKALVTAHVRGRALDLSPFETLTPQIRTLRGKLDVDLSAKGALAMPRPRGTIDLKGGKLRLRGMSLYEGLALSVALTPEEVQLRRFAMRSGEGDLVASASVQLAKLKPQRFALKAKASKLTIGAPPVRDGVFSGVVVVKGAFQPGNRLAVAVKVDDAALKLGTIGGSRSLIGVGVLPDVVFVDAEARRARKRAAEARARGELPLTMAIDVAADPVMVRADQANVEVATKLKVAVDKAGARVRGLLQLRRGRIEILSKTYKVERARIRFSGEKVPNPALDVQLSRRFGEAMVHITVRGTAKKPQLELSSDPAIYDRSQIVSLIVTGRVDPRSGGGQTDNTMAVANAVSQALLGSVLSSIAPKVGIDVARVNLGQTKDEKGETRLRAEAELGKYLTERLYVGYRRVFGATNDENANEGLLEFRLTARWLLMAVFGDAGVGGVDALWTYRY